jgi:hypothetical protein
MITPTCPKCGRTIPGDDINVARDVAYCRKCNLSHTLSALSQIDELSANLDLQRPPAGASYTSDGMGTVIRATHRSLGTAIGALLFGLFWNGIVSVFVWFAVTATLHNLHVTLPDWFPTPKMNGGVGVGMNIFLWIFLTPFMAIGLFLAGTFLSCLFGRTEVRVTNNQGEIFVGCGPFGYRRRFETAEVKDVRIENSFNWRSNGSAQNRTFIILETRDGKQIKFGTMLSYPRRQFVAAAVRQTVMK